MLRVAQGDVVRDLAEIETCPWRGHALLAGALGSNLLDVHAAAAALRDWNVVKRYPLHGALAHLCLSQLESEIGRVSRAFGVDPSEVMRGSRRREVCRARTAIAHLAFHVHRLRAASPSVSR